MYLKIGLFKAPIIIFFIEYSQVWSEIMLLLLFSDVEEIEEDLSQGSGVDTDDEYASDFEEYDSDDVREPPNPLLYRRQGLAD